MASATSHSMVAGRGSPMAALHFAQKGRADRPVVETLDNGMKVHMRSGQLVADNDELEDVKITSKNPVPATSLSRGQYMDYEISGVGIQEIRKIILLMNFTLTTTTSTLQGNLPVHFKIASIDFNVDERIISTVFGEDFWDADIHRYTFEKWQDVKDTLNASSTFGVTTAITTATTTAYTWTESLDIGGPFETMKINVSALTALGHKIWFRVYFANQAEFYAASVSSGLVPADGPIFSDTYIRVQHQKKSPDAAAMVEREYTKGMDFRFYFPNRQEIAMATFAVSTTYDVLVTGITGLSAMNIVKIRAGGILSYFNPTLIGGTTIYNQTTCYQPASWELKNKNNQNDIGGSTMNNFTPFIGVSSTVTTTGYGYGGTTAGAGVSVKPFINSWFADRIPAQCLQSSQHILMQVGAKKPISVIDNGHVDGFYFWDNNHFVFTTGTSLSQILYGTVINGTSPYYITLASNSATVGFHVWQPAFLRIEGRQILLLK